MFGIDAQTVSAIVPVIKSLRPNDIITIILFYQAWTIRTERKNQHEEALKRFQAWQDASIAEQHQTAALEKISEVVLMSSQAQQRSAEELRILTLKLEERFPPRGAL